FLIQFKKKKKGKILDKNSTPKKINYQRDKEMTSMSEEALKEEAKSELKLLSLEHVCFNKDWVLRLNPRSQIDHFICLICKQIANSPMEISCPQHEQMDELLIVGEDCLNQYLKDHNNSCPIAPHANCKYSRNRALQRLVGDLTVMCPRQCMQGGQQTGNETEGESETSGIIRCNFQGKLKELNDHLSNDCSLKAIDCWFKPFGCNQRCSKHNLNDHLISSMKFHFDMVNQLFQSMQQTIQSQRGESNQLKSEINQLRLQMKKMSKMQIQTNSTN
ncbi:hypothetical protein RFI_16516, partial [Reticulomyxa filosa]